ncbi:YggT family protein [Paenibacillus cellulosilyticus]|uniref:YggT family protein n=1 Tax=Paenibacillus cellulosilyticus TaxID=375489 RepID=A0A2V2YC60_9BACL|nr:YggT family protein [Paenibacillus cellulosilyticus]PWV89394.1 YggT family protein [Paenibacillus cellulosilyticus]QKS43143.1 YggT family protein [Paenibacillus cellulosilyticus]
MLSTLSWYVFRLEDIYTFLIIGYVLLSWLPNARDSFIGQLLGKIVEPYLSIFRRFIPPIGGMLDISPFIAVLALSFIAYGIIFVLDIFL